MFELKIEGKTWPEVTKQLAELIGEKQGATGDGLELENRKMREELSNAQLIIQQLDEELAEATLRIEDLQKQIGVKAPDENPTSTPAAGTASTGEEAATTAPTKEPAVAPDPEPEQPTFKKEDVRAFLAEARNKGVNITDVLKPFGGRFPSVKEKDYPALMEATKKALAEKGAK